MRRNIDIDGELLKKAMEMSGAKTKKEVVELALQEYINMKRRHDLISLMRGKVEFWDDEEATQTPSA